MQTLSVDESRMPRSAWRLSWAALRASPKKLRPAETTSSPPKFLPFLIPNPASAVAVVIPVELRRGATTVTVTWPASAASECGLRTDIERLLARVVQVFGVARA